MKKWFGPKEDEKGKDKKESEDGGDEDSDGSAEDGTTTKKVEKAQADPDGYQVFKMPWSLSFSYYSIFVKIGLSLLIAIR